MSSAADRPRRGRRRTQGPDPIANDRRAVKRKQTLGPDPACAFCGERTPGILTRLNRTTLEEHHVSGKANDPELTVVLCRNCHALVTERQLRLGAELRHGKGRTLLEREAAALVNRAAFDRGRADAEQAQARKLTLLAARLDAECKGWRKWPEAQA